MTIQERMAQSEQRFNELTKQRDDINTELLKLQGEYRVLQELQANEKPSKVNKVKADTVEVVPEGEVV